MHQVIEDRAQESTLQLSKLMMEKAYYLHMRRLFPKMRLLLTDTDSVMVQIFKLQDPLHAMAEANLNVATFFDVAGKSKDPERDLSAAARSKATEVMGQLGKLGDETFPARILEYVGLRSKMYSILTVQPDGARKEKRKIKGKAVTNVRHLEYREVLEEGSERRAAFAQLRSRAHEIAVETVEKKSLSPFNDKVYGLDAHNSRPLGHWRNLEQLRMLGASAEQALNVPGRHRRPGAELAQCRAGTLAVPSRHLSRREQALVDVPSRHSAKQAQALATVKVVEWLAQPRLMARPMSTGSPNEYGLAQQL